MSALASPAGRFSGSLLFGLGILKSFNAPCMNDSTL